MAPNLNPASVLAAEFLRSWLDGDRPFLHTHLLAKPIAAATALPHDAAIVRCATLDNGVEVLARVGQAEVLLSSRIGSSTVQVIAPQDDVARAVLERIIEHAADPPRGTTPIQMWWWRDGGRSAYVKREIQTPSWSSIRRNYPTKTTRHLEALMGVCSVPPNGRLILWHGEPGTGKTTALRSLIAEWAPWCTANVVMDPERLFGEAAYLAEVLTSSTTRTGGPTLTSAGDATTPARLIVAEDSDQYLRASARRDAGAALGRLLNTADGMLAQGSESIVLITTNEDVGRLHPALTRPGRCLASIEFQRFSTSEASTWIGRSGAIAHPATLAELLARRGDFGDLHAGPSVRLATGAYL